MIEIFNYNNFLNILGIFVFLSAIHGIFLSIQIFTKSAKSKANIIFSILLVIVSLHLIEVLIYLRGYTYLIPHLDGTTFPLIFLLGPLYFFYVSYLINPKLKFKLYYLLHLLPALFIFFVYLPYYLIDADIKAEGLKQFAEILRAGELTKLSSTLLWRLIFHALQLTGYLTASYFIVRKFKRHAEKNISRVDAINKINWLSKTTLFFGLYTGAYLLMLLSLIVINSYYILIDTVWLFFVSLFIHFASYSVINKPKFEAGDIEEITAFEEKNNEEKYKTSSLKNDQIDLIHEKLMGIMEDEKIFLNDQIRISEVAEKLDVTSHHLSQVINQKEKLNFFEYVNKHRVEESIRLLKEDKEESKKLLAIAFESGFNNKVSFNRTFKKITGKTPSQYRKSL